MTQDEQDIIVGRLLRENRERKRSQAVFEAALRDAGNRLCEIGDYLRKCSVPVALVTLHSKDTKKAMDVGRIEGILRDYMHVTEALEQDEALLLRLDIVNGEVKK